MIENKVLVVHEVWEHDMAITKKELKVFQRLGITPEQLSQFCQQWQVAELALFGSILREDFNTNSDIDVLVEYQPAAKRGLLEKLRMRESLSQLVGYDVDLVSKKAIQRSRNWLRRDNILNTAMVIYAA